MDIPTPSKAASSSSQWNMIFITKVDGQKAAPVVALTSLEFAHSTQVEMVKPNIFWCPADERVAGWACQSAVPKLKDVKNTSFTEAVSLTQSQMDFSTTRKGSIYMVSQMNWSGFFQRMYCLLTVYLPHPSHTRRACPSNSAVVQWEGRLQLRSCLNRVPRVPTVSCLSFGKQLLTPAPTSNLPLILELMSCFENKLDQLTVLPRTCLSSVSISRCSVRKGQRLCWVGRLQCEMAVGL